MSYSFVPVYHTTTQAFCQELFAKKSDFFSEKSSPPLEKALEGPACKESRRRGRPWRGRLFRRGSPLQASPCENFPGRRPPVEKIANDSAPPAGGSRGSLFWGGMQKQEHIAMKCDLPCISENRTAAIGCPVFDGMGVFICNII